MPEVDAWIWVLIVGIAVAVPVAAGVAVYRTAPDGRLRGAVAVGAALGAWLVAVLVLGGANVFRADADAQVPLIGAAVGVPVVAGILLARSQSVQRLAGSIPQTWLLSAQAPRVLGVVFLVLWSQGKLPGHFALGAGLGDIAVGVAGPLVAWVYSRRSTLSRKVALAYNMIGITDLVFAVGTGFLSAPSPLRLFLTEPSTQVMTVLPMVLVPAFLVPTFLFIHLVSIAKLTRQPAVGVAGSPKLQPS